MYTYVCMNVCESIACNIIDSNVFVILTGLYGIKHNKLILFSCLYSYHTIQIDKWVDRWTDGRMDGWDVWLKKSIYIYAYSIRVYIYVYTYTLHTYV